MPFASTVGKAAYCQLVIHSSQICVMSSVSHIFVKSSMILLMGKSSSIWHYLKLLWDLIWLSLPGSFCEGDCWDCGEQQQFWERKLQKCIWRTGEKSEVGKFSLMFLYLSTSILSPARYNLQIKLLLYTVFQSRICIIRLQHIYIQKWKLNLILNNIVLSMFLILFIFLYLLLSTVFSILFFWNTNVVYQNCFSAKELNFWVTVPRKWDLSEWGNLSV